MPTEDALRGAADQLRLHADAAGVLLDDVTRLATEDLWAGPVADAFAVELGQQRSQLRTARDELLATAQQLERQAEALKEAREAAAAAEAERLRRAAEEQRRSHTDNASTSPRASRGHTTRYFE